MTNPTTTPSSLIQAARPNLHCPRPPRARHEPRPTALTFAPLAWLKLRLFLHTDEVEVGFFGISAATDLLYVEDLAVLKQTVTQVTVAFDDVAVAEHFDRCADAGISPARCGRIWVHTHPGSSTTPSFTDEATFERVFGQCDWAVMAIVARNGTRYARLAFNAGPGGSAIIPVHVDWERLPKDLLKAEGSIGEMISGWMDEYGENILPEVSPLQPFDSGPEASDSSPRFRDLMDELDELYDQRLLEEDQLSHFEREWEVQP